MTETSDKGPWPDGTGAAQPPVTSRRGSGKDGMVERPAAFEDFVAARGQRLLRMAWLLTGDTHLAEDLLQTALVKVWPKWDRVARGNPEAYIRTVLVNTHASWWQRRWRGEVSTGLLPDTTATRDTYAEVDAEHDLAAAIRGLPRQQRAVVMLRFFEDLSVEQTAAELGCSTGTVKSQTSRALHFLRERWPALGMESEVP